MSSGTQAGRCVLCAFAVVVLLAADTAWAADLGKAKGLMKIGDYAGALSALGNIIADAPEDPEARLLMATCFANYEIDLQMPGNVVVGRNNAERATYQLGILLRLGDEGKKLLLAAIEGPNEKLSNFAINVARRERFLDAIGPLARIIERAEASPPHVGGAIIALADIGADKVAASIVKLLNRDKVDDGVLTVALEVLGRYPTPEAAAPIKKLADKETNQTRKITLIGYYLRFLSDEDRVAISRTTKDPTILGVLSTEPIEGKRRAAVLSALATRSDLDDQLRVKAVDGLVSALGTDKKACVELLSRLLDDKSAAVAWRATTVLAGIEPERAVQRLVDALADPAKVAVAKATLSTVRCEAVAEPLLKVIEDKNDPAKAKNWAITRGEAFSLFVNSGPGKGAILRAIRLITTPVPGAPPEMSPHVLISALARNPHYVAALHDLAADKDAKLRRVVLQCAAKADPPKERIALALKMLGDQEADIRRSAERIVMDNADAAGVATDTLALLLKSEEEWMVRQLAERFANQADKEALEPMLDLLKDEKRARWASQALMAYFAAVPDERAVDPILAAVLAVPWPDSADKAGAALKKCTKDISTLARQVARWLSDKDWNVRSRAATILKVLGDKSVLDDLVQAASREQEGSNRRPFDDAIRELLKQK